MEVWVFDTKRNAQVLKGRLEQEQHARRKEESMMDLELDFLAPYLQRIPDISSMTRGQAIEVSNNSGRQKRVKYRNTEYRSFGNLTKPNRIL